MAVFVTVTFNQKNPVSPWEGSAPQEGSAGRTDTAVPGRRQISLYSQVVNTLQGPDLGCHRSSFTVISSQVT